MMSETSCIKDNVYVYLPAHCEKESTEREVSKSAQEL